MNKYVCVFFLLFVLAANCFSQSFEGQIVYSNTYKSKIPNVSNDQFSSMMGDTQTYMIKGGNYKSSMNGSMMQWQLYRQADNRHYVKMAGSPAILWTDGATNPDEVQKA